MVQFKNILIYVDNGLDSTETSKHFSNKTQWECNTKCRLGFIADTHTHEHFRLWVNT